ncbi:uncharacterized protein LOC144157699 [Haemaphysalis longicornis]
MTWSRVHVPSPCWAPWWVAGTMAEQFFQFMASFFRPSDPSRKRGGTDATAQFFTKNVANFPRFHVIHSSDEEKTARLVSPFLVAKTLTATIGEGYKIKKLANGDLLLEVLYKHQLDKLSALTSFGEIPVTVSEHRSLNTVRGVISDDDLRYVSEEELLEGLKEQNVTNVYRIKIKRENKEIQTRHIVLTFASSILPESVEVGYTKIKLRPYIPNPRRCYKCQRYGHGSLNCRGQQTCAKCASHEHPPENCQAQTYLCVNCEGNHAAYSRVCPAWKKEKEIITLKVTENLTFREARRRLSSAHTRPYSVLPGIPAGSGLPAPKPMKRTVSTWTFLEGKEPPVSFFSARPWKRQRRPRVRQSRSSACSRGGRHDQSEFHQDHAAPPPSSSATRRTAPAAPPGPLQPGPAVPALATSGPAAPPAPFPAPVVAAPLPAALPVPPAALAPALAEQLVRAALPSLINSVVEDLATDPSFIAAITAEVRRTTSRVAEAVLLVEDVPLPAALCAALEAATAGTPEGMEVADDATFSSSAHSENLQKF